MISTIWDSHLTFEKIILTFFVVIVQILMICIYLKSITDQNLYYMFFHPIAESVSFLHVFILVNLRRVQNIIYFCTTLVG